MFKKSKLLLPLGLLLLGWAVATPYCVRKNQDSPVKKEPSSASPSPSPSQASLTEPSMPTSETSNYPDFSWDHLPLYMHIRKASAFNEKELKYLASFPLITFEKTTGSKTFGSTDLGTIEAAKAVKKINPNAKVLFYRNIIVHYGGYPQNEDFEKIKSPYLLDKRGKPVMIRERLKAYDFSNPEVQDWWVKAATEPCQDQAIDGLFIDGSVKVLSSFLRPKLTPEKKAKLLEAYDTTMTRTREALRPDQLMLANLLRVRLENGGLDKIPLFDGSYLENFDVPTGNQSGVEFMVQGIKNVQQAARQGKIIAMTLGLGESAATDDKIDDVRKKVSSLRDHQERINYCIALFLVCAEKHSYLCLHDGYSAEKRRGKYENAAWLKMLSEYKKPLGPPQGPAKQEGHLFTREFAHCSVLLDVKNKTGKLTWK